MKRLILLVLAACTLMLAGCSTQTYTGKTDDYAATVTYAVRTNVDYPTNMEAVYFQNGYAVVYVHGHKNGEKPADFCGKCGFNAMDGDGKLLFDDVFYSMTNFDTEGWAAARTYPVAAENYIRIHVSGKTEPATRAQYDSYTGTPWGNSQSDTDNMLAGRWWLSASPRSLSDRSHARAENGVAPLLVFCPELPGENDHLLGLTTVSAEVLLAPSVPICGDSVVLHENKIVINDNGKLCILNVSVEQE